MGELLLLATLIALVILTIRRGKPVVLDNPLIIQRSGRYHITLAPQLNRAQTFLENIAKQFAESGSQAGDTPVQCFEVQDLDASCYLLAVALRGGMLYFQAINPQPLLRDADSHLKTLRDFSEAVLELHPLVPPTDDHAAGLLRDAVESAARPLKIAVKILQEIH